MPTNSTLPETDNSQLQEDEESYSAGNGRLALLVGLLLALALGGYLFVPGQKARRVITSVMPSVMLGEASVTGSRAVEEPAAAPPAPATPAAEEVAKPVAAPAARPVARPAAETSLDSRAVAAVSAPAEPVVEEAAPAEITAPAAPTTLTLTGRIFDENGRPLAGATVLLKGSRKGTGTDANGNYSLEVPTGENMLVYGYGGYEDQEVRTRGSQPVTVTLLPAESAKRRRK